LDAKREVWPDVSVVDDSDNSEHKKSFFAIRCNAYKLQSKQQQTTTNRMYD